MCGIWFQLGDSPTAEAIQNAIETLEARGPEAYRTMRLGAGTAVFTRLAINGLDPAGMQPFEHDTIAWMCNGEIYNWRDLAEDYGLNAPSGSDCEVLGHLYRRFVAEEVPLKEYFRNLDGVFAIVIADAAARRVIVARDPYGVRPLYKGLVNGALTFASEIKALGPTVKQVEAFAPGTYEVYQDGVLIESVAYHTIPYQKDPAHGLVALRQSLEVAVQKRMMTERPVAALLSGGIDSSLIASLVAEELRKVGAPPLETFSIGMKGSTDLAYARKVANWIGSKHHEIVLTATEFFDAIPEVIRAIESYDTTTVRASVGNWLVAKAIRERSECKVVFNGDGSDEVFGSYLYFYNAPSDAAFEAESERLLKEIHMFDVLRSDRSISSHGLEPRTPFLDKAFVSVARSLSTGMRRPERGGQPEKYALRMAFDGFGFLPDEVLWRRKEAFSDGVSGQEESWYQIAQKEAARRVPADWKARAALEYGNGPTAPTTPEQYYYRSVFAGLYPAMSQSCPNVPHFWLPRWSGGATDPSARTLDIYGADSKSGNP